MDSGFWVLIIEDGLHHPTIEEKPLNLTALMVDTLVGWAAVDQELGAFNRDCSAHIFLTQGSR